MAGACMALAICVGGVSDMSALEARILKLHSLFVRLFVCTRSNASNSHNFVCTLTKAANTLKHKQLLTSPPRRAYYLISQVSQGKRRGARERSSFDGDRESEWF
jgi:hypothetical protein